jgi:hypothetical protein
MTTSLHQATVRLERFFAGLDTRPGVMARRLLGVSKPEDERLAELLCIEHRARTKMDGSIGGSLVSTAWAAWEMMDLGFDALQGGLSRLVSWVLTFLESPPAAAAPTPLALPNGTVLTSEAGATFAAECLGLRVLLRARQDARPRVLRRLERVLSLWPTVHDELAASALGVVAVAPVPYHDRLESCVERVGAAQHPDGTWGEANLFHMLESLLLAGIRPARAVIERAVPALLAVQRPDGSFDTPANEERALIGLRALLVAQQG